MILFKLPIVKKRQPLTPFHLLEHLSEKDVRQNDHDAKCYFRSAERVIHMNGSWYFVTREGEEGPYPTECEAQLEVARFISEQTELQNFQAAREEKRARGRKLELVGLDDRPRIRPSEPLLRKQKVHI